MSENTSFTLLPCSSSPVGDVTEVSEVRSQQCTTTRLLRALLLYVSYVLIPMDFKQDVLLLLTNPRDAFY